jgi:hypothetical protein
MREAFEAWAQRNGQLTRRREDRPDEYLVYETQRRWLIWQAALAHGAAVAEAKPGIHKPAGDEQAIRAQVLNEVLDAVRDQASRPQAEQLEQLIAHLKQQPAPVAG